jgi:uncharacterized protein YueI
MYSQTLTDITLLLHVQSNIDRQNYYYMYNQTLTDITLLLHVQSNIDRHNITITCTIKH